jgi:hypothetical protein
MEKFRDLAEAIRQGMVLTAILAGFSLFVVWDASKERPRTRASEEILSTFAVPGWLAIATAWLGIGYFAVPDKWHNLQIISFIWILTMAATTSLFMFGIVQAVARTNKDTAKSLRWIMFGVMVFIALMLMAMLP